VTLPAGLLDDLAALVEATARCGGGHVARRQFGARDIEFVSDHPSGLTALTAALPPAAGDGRPVLRALEADPQQLAFLGALGPADLGSYGGLLGLGGSGWAAAWEPARGRFIALQASTSIAVFARGSPVPPREVAEPLRPLLHWASVADGSLAVHAGALALGGDAVLVAGPGGAGKTTFVRAGAGAGLDFLGDNIAEVVLGPDGPSVHGVFASLKVRLPAAFPGALPEVSAAFDALVQKDVYCFGAGAGATFGRPARLRGLLVVDGDGPAAPEPMSRADALFAIGPNSVAQYPLYERELFARCGELVRTVPAWRVGRLTTVAEHRAVVEALLAPVEQ
jgi:hypothetical protein